MEVISNLLQEHQVEHFHLDLDIPVIWQNCNFGGEYDGAMNLVLWPDVYCIIIQSLEVVSKLDICLFHTIDAWPH